MSPEPELPRLVVLVSGGGSNLQAIMDAVAAGSLAARIAAVISNEPGAGGLARARRAGIETLVVNHRAYPDRRRFDAALADAVSRYDPALVVLAGFMRILGPAFVGRYPRRIVNIHPSLLPSYPGLDTHARALADGVSEHGATVHFVTEGLDAGPVIVQARVPVRDGDTPQTLQRRVLTEEHRIYPRAIGWALAGRLAIDGDRVRLDGRPVMPGPGRS